MSHHHSKNPRNFNPLNKQNHSAPSRHTQPRHLNTILNRSHHTHSHELKSGPSQRLDCPKLPTQSEPQNPPDQPKMGLTFNLHSNGMSALPKLPKFKRLPKDNERPNPTSPTVTTPSSTPLVPLINKPTPNSTSRPSDHSRRAPSVFPRGVNQIPLGKSNRSPWTKVSSSSRMEKNDVPIKSPPKRNRTNSFRRQMGSEVSTEPTKTRRIGHSGSNGQSSGTFTTTQDAGDETEEDLDFKHQTVTESRPPSNEKVSKPSDQSAVQAQCLISLPSTTPAPDANRISTAPVDQSSLIKSTNNTLLIDTVDVSRAPGSGPDTLIVNPKASEPPLKSSPDSSNLSSAGYKGKNNDTIRSEPPILTHAQSGLKRTKPAEIDSDSSLSSLSSDDEEEDDSSDSSSSMSADTIEIASPPFEAMAEPQAPAQSEIINDDSTLLNTLTTTAPVTLERPPETSPSRAPITDIVTDDASELGEDVCLEYTDFGANELGVPVTWSESEYDEGEKSDETDEFAEFLLMEASDYDLTDMTRFQSIDHDLGENFDLESHFGSDSGGSSQTGYMIIEEFESLQTHEPDEEEIEVEEEDGDTTDSLDEDDHSGLVKFGIEVDEEEEDDAMFFDLPPDSALGSLLTNFELSGDVEFFVLPEEESANASPQATRQIIESPSISTSCLLPAPSGLCTTRPLLNEALGITPEIQLPVMGSFSVAKSAGRTIIDEKAIPPISPFTGGKVVRYNRFKKLRDQSCGNDSERSSLGTPKPDSNHPAEQSAPEDDFDITAFIHGISSKDEEDFFDFGNAEGMEESSEERGGKSNLDDLSRWRRVPMTAFRMSNEPAQPIMIDGAIQPSARAGQKTLSLVQQKKLNAKSLLLSPNNRKSRSKRGTRKDEINHQAPPQKKRGRVEEEEELRLAINEMFDTPLFKSVIERNQGVAGGEDQDVPMLNLMDGIEGLPIE